MPLCLCLRLTILSRTISPTRVSLELQVEMDYVQHVALRSDVADLDDENDEDDEDGVDALVEEYLRTQTRKSLDELLSAGSLRFHERFTRTFALSRQQHSAPVRKTAKAALSNLIGGMGYFSGSELIETSPADPALSRPQLSAPSPPGVLFTAVPSRPFFPRGFLWDEGFHQLLLSEWDIDLRFVCSVCMYVNR
jgi:Glycosyl hydrolase family 63 C-terminal domain